VLTPFSKNKRRQTVAEKDKTLSLLCDLSEMIFALFSRYKGGKKPPQQKREKGDNKRKNEQRKKKQQKVGGPFSLSYQENKVPT